MKPLILIPVYNDWKIAPILLEKIDHALSATEHQARILFIDDGSTDECNLTALDQKKYKHIDALSVLVLGRNLGNQRALAVGLVEAVKNETADCLIIMDGDGEDNPEYIPQFLEKFFADPKQTTIFAKRVKRSEGLKFRIFYFFYQTAYRLLTGKSISMGNFSIMSVQTAKKLILLSELWNHFSAAYIKSRIPWNDLNTVRASRIAGKSGMNLTSLVMHGINGFSVHADTVGIRSILATLTLMCLGVIGIIALICIRTFTDLAIPGWTSTLVLSILAVVFQAFIGSLLLAFIVLSGRSSVVMTPALHFAQFIIEKRKIF